LYIILYIHCCQHLRFRQYSIDYHVLEGNYYAQCKNSIPEKKEKAHPRTFGPDTHTKKGVCMPSLAEMTETIRGLNNDNHFLRAEVARLLIQCSRRTPLTQYDEAVRFIGGHIQGLIATQNIPALMYLQTGLKKLLEKAAQWKQPKP